MCRPISQELGLQDFLLIGKGMRSQSSVPQSLMADVFESMVASIYLDGGWGPVREFIHRLIVPRISLLAEGHPDENFKSLLQQWAQKTLAQTPTYVLLAMEGPDHTKSFRIAAKVGDLQFEPAWGQQQETGGAMGRSECTDGPSECTRCRRKPTNPKEIDYFWA